GRALDEVRKIVADGGAEQEARRSALRTLISGRGQDLPPLLLKLLGDKILGHEALRGLAQCDDPGIPRAILDQYPRLDPEARSIAVNTLVSRPAHARALLEAVAKGAVGRQELSAFHARQIRSFDNADLTAKLTEVWGETRATDAEKHKLIEQYKERFSA